MTTEAKKPADGGAKPPAEAGSKESEFDKLLKEFDSSNTAAKPDLTELVKGLKPVIDYADGQRQKEAKAAFENDVKSAVLYLQEADEMKKASPKLIRGFLEAKASEDAGFKAAFEDRANNPAAWNAKLEDARKEAAKEFSPMLTDDVRSDLEAAKAAIGGKTDQALEKGPDPVALFRMNDQAFEDYKAKLPRQQ